MINSFILHSNDTVAIVNKPISKGENVVYIFDDKEITIEAMEDIPRYHKIAIKRVKKGNRVLKYGEVIGYATTDIEIGYHVHTQNLSDLVERMEEL